ncbi:MAG: cupin domain-containing protein [Thaumarchaeota archaeon]|nr:cupin domain-containing protein [Nitrososphaerota archaeon]
MQKENFYKITVDKSLLAKKRNYFLGGIILHDISKNIGVKDQKVYYAAFKNGAKTKLHHHEGSQVLVVTQGTGTLVLYKKIRVHGKTTVIKQETKTMLKAGDIACIPKNTLHWHGAIRGKSFAHVAFNGFSAQRKEARTIWYDSNFKSIAVRIS